MHHFLQNFWKQKKFCYILITWPLNLNFHHLVKKIILPAKFHFNPHWGNFYNMLLFRFKKDLKGQNHSSSDSNHQIKIPLPAKFPISPLGRYPRASHRCREYGDWGVFIWRSSYVSKVASYSLQIYQKWTSSHMFFKDFRAIPSEV